MEFFDYNFLLNSFTLVKIPGYIDPGSATAIIAMIIGAIAGAGMTIKLYWLKIKLKIQFFVWINFTCYKNSIPNF